MKGFDVEGVVASNISIGIDEHLLWVIMQANNNSGRVVHGGKE